jgi:hypothetical protein
MGPVTVTVGSPQDQSPNPQQPPTQASQPPSVEGLAERSTRQFGADLDKARQQQQQLIQDRDSTVIKALHMSGLAKFFASDEDMAQRAQLIRQWVQAKTQEAQQPFEQAVKGHLDRAESLKQAVQQGQIAMGDFQTRQEMDPSGPISENARQAWNKTFPNIPLAPGTSAFHLKGIIASIPQLQKAFADQMSGIESGTRAKTLPGTAAADITLKRAQAKEAEAKAKLTESQIGSGPAPGWERTGEVAYNPDNDKEHQKDVASTEIITRNATSIQQLLGNKNFLPALRDPNKAAQIQERTGALAEEMRNQMAARGFPQSMIDFVGKMTGDPTKWTGSNVSGLSENKTRLEELKRIADEGLITRGRSRGFRRTGVAGNKPKQLKHKDGTIWTLQNDGTYAPKQDTRTANR